MKLQTIFRVIQALAPAAFLVLAGPATGGPKIIKAPQDTPPSEIAARYSISLNGFDLGAMDFTAKVGPGGYSVKSDVSISALLGAFTWHGVTQTTGKVVQHAFHPLEYRFDYTSTSRSGSVRMGFEKTAVTSLAVEPESFMAPDTVPLERSHLNGVLDPLSAIMVMTKADPANPCATSLTLFDGKQRFNLSLSYRRQDPFEPALGNPELLTVCRIKYTPIAGYRDNEDTRALAKQTGIEIAFRVLPAARLAVPHKVVIPTMAGDAILQAERVRISTPDNDKVAEAVQ